ncbi:hypothetical protein O9G_005594 [Rozella allomycis CSF55]|uniref:Uncharacterized protein n=1 Tax=Rozella allomycis (strain CSF55) TaxID=988480 RepID=A0A075B1Z0_ROZAC|nr:hypothetical protein O9G_005594 [Rozella allomycis CSF55]|eukprot:EPZ34986.1 hypothetical protein O9G_005594 [Rozella allomycis CSF55]
MLAMRSERIEQNRVSIWTKFKNVTRPFQIIFGLIFLIFSILFIISIALTTIDRAANSVCGSLCGFVVNFPEIFNPFNSVFVALSRVFPLDFIFFCFLVAYFVFATLSGIIRIGVRFLWIKLYEFKTRKTPPQALLITSILLVCTLFSFNFTLFYLTPQYTTFGSQRFCNSTLSCVEHPENLIPCSLTSPSEVCTPTTISTIINRVQVNRPIFGIIMIFSQCCTVLLFIISLIFLSCKKQRSVLDDDIDELE